MLVRSELIQPVECFAEIIPHHVAVVRRFGGVEYFQGGAIIADGLLEMNLASRQLAQGEENLAGIVV